MQCPSRPAGVSCLLGLESQVAVGGCELQSGCWDQTWVLCRRSKPSSPVSSWPVFVIKWWHFLSRSRAAYAYNPDPQLYAPSSAASYFETPSGAQVTVAASSSPAVPSHSMVGITMDVVGTPIMSGAGAYLIHGGMDSARHSLAHTARSSPATVCIEALRAAVALLA